MILQFYTSNISPNECRTNLYHGQNEDNFCFQLESRNESCANDTRSRCEDIFIFFHSNKINKNPPTSKAGKQRLAGINERMFFDWTTDRALEFNIFNLKGQFD